MSKQITTRWVDDAFMPELTVEQDGTEIARVVEIAMQDHPTFAVVTDDGYGMCINLSPDFQTRKEAIAWVEENLQSIPTMVSRMLASRR